MIQFFTAYQPLIDQFLIGAGYAFSQYIVLRAGVFSIATTGFAAIGAYTAAILSVNHGFATWLAVLIATVAGTLLGILLSVPLARLRGAYQAIATLAFVQIVLSLNLYAEGLTGGAMGLTGIPHMVDTGWLSLALAAVVYVMYAMSGTRIGRAFDAIRQDEAMAASLGISITAHQMLAFAISGAIAGLFGALEAFHSYALEPNRYGFDVVVAILSYVVLGGRRSVLGPLVGTAFVVVIPELARPLADNRLLVYGLLLMAVMAFLPRGLVDTISEAMHRRRMARFDLAMDRSEP